MLSIALMLSLLGCGEGSPQAKKVDVAAQIVALKGTVDSKSNALTELAAGGSSCQAAVKDIIPLLNDEDAAVRRLAAYALGEIGVAAKAAVPELTKMLQDSDMTAVTAAINALRAIDPSKAPKEAIPSVTQ